MLQNLGKTQFPPSVFLTGTPMQSCRSEGLVSMTTCDCEVEDQTTDHINSNCSFHFLSREIDGLISLDESTVVWLQKFCPEI